MTRSPEWVALGWPDIPMVGPPTDLKLQLRVTKCNYSMVTFGLCTNPETPRDTLEAERQAYTATGSPNTVWTPGENTVATSGAPITGSPAVRTS